MRRVRFYALAALLAGCSNGLAERQAALAHWIGKPETALVGAVGVPTRTYEAGGMKFLSYDDERVQILPGSPGIGPGPFRYGGGIPPTATTLVCETTFTIEAGIVRAFSLRGNACG